MEALKTIGINKAVAFVMWEFYKGLLAICVLPPLRGALLRFAGATIGRDCVVLNAKFINAHHYGFRRLRIGDHCFIADEALFDLRGGITLEAGVTLSNRVAVVTHINVGYPDHPLQKAYPTKEAAVIVKKGTYIGTGAMLLPGVTIGRGSVVAAGAVVTKNVPAHAVVAGVPARVIKKLR